MDLKVLCHLDGFRCRGDTFAVCALPKEIRGQMPEEFNFFIRDERTMVEIIYYDYREISEAEFGIFLAFECGPEAKSRVDDDVHSRLYIPK